MTGLGLDLFQTGSLGVTRHDVSLNQVLGEDFEIPVPWYLITHPHGNVVVDQVQERRHLRSARSVGSRATTCPNPRRCRSGSMSTGFGASLCCNGADTRHHLVL